jgi:WD40 repeat protein
LPAALTGESVSAAAAADVARLAAGYVCGETVVGSVALLLRESVTMMTLPRWTIRALVAFGGCLLAAGTLWPSWAGKNRAPLNPIAHAAPVREPVPEPGRDLFGDPLPPGAMARFGTVAFRPRTVADQLKFDASGRTLFSLGMTASIWDVATGRELLAVVPPGRDGCLWGAQLDPDGRTLVTLTQDLPKPKLYLRRWSIADQKDTALPELKLAELIVRLRDRGHAVNGPYGPGFTFAPDGNMLAVLDQGGEGVLWDVAMGREIRRLTGAGSPASAIGFTPRGDRIVTSHDDHEFRVWDVATGIEVRRFAGPGVEVTQLSFSADGRRMSAVSFPMKPAAPKVRAVSVWDTESGKVVRNIETDSMRVCWASLAPDGTSVFTTEVVSEVICALRQYNLATGQTRTLSLSQNGGPRVWTLAVAPDGRTLAAATIDGPIHFWDLPSGVEKHPRGLRGNVSETALAPDGRTAWTLTPFGVVFQWDVSSGRELRRLKAEPDLEWSKSVALSSDGKMLAVGELYATDKNGWGKIALWDTATGLLLRRLSARGDHMAFTPDGRTLATIDELDSQIRFWNPVTGKEDRPTIAGQKATDNGRKTTTGLRFLENARKLMAFGSGFAVIWDVESGREERDYPLGGRASHVSADGRLLATVKGRARVNVGPGQTLCEIEVLDLKTGDIVFSAGIDDSVDAVAISPDASVLAVSYGDVRSAIDFWSLKTKDMLGTVTGHRRRIISLAFTPDGRRLVSGSQDTTALVWEVPK